MPPGPDLRLSHSFNDALSVTHGGIRFRASQRLHRLLNCSLLRLTTSSVAVARYRQRTSVSHCVQTVSEPSWWLPLES